MITSSVAGREAQALLRAGGMREKDVGEVGRSVISKAEAQAERSVA